MTNSLRFRLPGALILALFASACAAPISQTMPAARMHSPEAQGKGGIGSLNLGWGGADKAELTHDLVQRIPNTNDPALGRTGTVRMGAGVGLGDRVDADFILPLRLQLKWQALGFPRAEARKGNVSLALTAAVGYGFERGEGNDTWQIFHRATHQQAESAWEMKNINGDGSVILGWRFADALMLYGGPFFSSYRFNGGYTQRNTSGAVTAQGSFSGSSRQKGAHLGLDWGKDVWSFRVEGSVTRAESGSSESTRGYFGFLLTAFLK